MNDEVKDASRPSEEGKHRHEPRQDLAIRRQRYWPKWLGRAEREWLKQSWAATEEFLNCNTCVPLEPTQRETIRRRWLEEAKHYDDLWRTRRRWDYALRTLIVIGAATVPVLAGLGAGRVPTALVGLGVAILAGLDGLFQLGDRWRQLRQTASLMTREGWSFLERTGPYVEATSHGEAYRGFLDRIEDLNASQTEEYRGVFEKRRPPETG